MGTKPPTDLKAVKKMEKAIAKEAQADEQECEHALKELKRTEKSQAKAFEVARKADKHLKKVEDKEHDAIKSLQKATHKHDQALTDLHTAQSEVQIQTQRAQRLRQNVDSLKVRTDELFKAKQIHDEERSQRLAHLHPPDRTAATMG